MKNILKSLVLIFLIFSTTTSIYASVVKDDNVYINETSDSYIINETLISDSKSTLIPSNQVRTVNDVHTIQYEYELIVKDGLVLDAEIIDLVFSNSTVTEANLEAIFNFHIDIETVESLDYSEHLFEGKESAIRVIVSLSISMNEPSTHELYQQLAGGQLMFNVSFYAN
ncbi:MAG: hypothetical protein K9L74_01305 [Candidatus Izimaplasma sp.]|nr:hypothetical protein [Candidatus Izimaplasma bacterium]